MITQYATFDPAHVGSGIDLEATNTIISVGTNNTLNQYTRATLGKDELTWYVELAVWGEASLAGNTSIGIVNASAATNQYVGGDANGWGYKLAEGEIHNNGADISGSSGVATAAAKQIIGIELSALNDSGASFQLSWYLEGVLIASVNIPNDTYYLAVSLAVPSGNDSLKCFLNAGQRAFFHSSSLGWYQIPEQVPAIRIAAQDYIDAPTSVYPNAVYDAKIIGRSRTRIASAISFWPDGKSQTRSSAMKLSVANTDAAFDSWLNYDIQNVPVNLYEFDSSGNKVLKASLQMTELQAVSDSQVRIGFGDEVAALERPLQTLLIPPYATEANANRPWPIVLGAARSLSPVLIDEVNLIYAVSDIPVIGLGYVRDKGDPWNPNGSPPDYYFSDDKLTMTVADHAAPQGKVTADLSSVGGGTPPTASDDIWDSYGNPFTFDSSGNPVGWTEGGTTGAVTQYGANVVLETSLVAPYIKQATNLIGGRAYRYHLEFNFSGYGNGRFGGHFGIYYKHDLGGGDDWHPLVRWSNIPPPYGDNNFGQKIIAEGTIIAPANVPVSLLFEANAHGYKVYIAKATLLLIPDTYTPAAIEPIKLAPFTESILINKAQLTRDKVDLTSAADIDTDSGYTGIGFFAGEEMTVRDAMEESLSSYTACMFQGDDGRVKFQRLVAPENETSVADIEEADLLTELVKTADKAPGLSTRMGYRRNWTVLDDTDFVTDFIDVPRDVRRALSHTHQGIVASAVQLPAIYRHAIQTDPIGTLLDSEANAQTEIDRICTIYSVPRASYTTEVFDPQFSVGDVVTLTHSRYGLQDGVKMLVKEMIRDLVSGTATITLWGKSL